MFAKTLVDLIALQYDDYTLKIILRSKSTKEVEKIDCKLQSLMTVLQRTLTSHWKNPDDPSLLAMIFQIQSAHFHQFFPERDF